MAGWGFVLTDESGVELGDVEASGLTPGFTRNAAAQVRFGADVEDDVATAINDVLRNGIPRLKGYRDGRLRFHGLWTPMVEEAGDGAQLCQFAFRDPFDLLAERWTAASRVFTAEDAGSIAWTLIAETNAESPTLIRQGTIATTAARDRTYEHKQLSEAIIQLTEVDGGFDFAVTPVDEPDAIGAFDVFAGQGQDRSAVVAFEYGDETDANVRLVRRNTYPPLNKVRVLGEGGPFQEDSDAASIAKYGLRMKVVQANDGTTELPTLLARATAMLRPDPIRVVEFVPDPELAPQPWDDYWLGDTVEFRSLAGSLSTQAAVRVNGIEIALDDEGNEASHTLTFDSEEVAPGG